MGTIQDQESSQAIKTEEPTPSTANNNNSENNTNVDTDNTTELINDSSDNNPSGTTNITTVSGNTTSDDKKDPPGSLPTSTDNSGENSKDSETKPNDPPCSSPVDGGGEGSVVKIPKSGGATQKASGIPALSRIARPCVGQQKPALPPVTPTKNAYDDTLRSMTDEFGKHRLTDVQEENEDDTLGTTYYRRNTSVLTEDTDSFIIGDRVWVGGTKPGQIAYIGETQFAPGEWAGIALDQPIGKNDGSVGGIRYFQCEPKRGVFSRLTRLTRVPLNGADEFSFSSSSFSITSTPANNGVRRRVGSPLSPTGSTRSLRKSPPLSTSNTSLSSSIAHIVDFKVGDRVIIKSSQGSKIGTLRYMGTADFAAGEWCGVELDEPRGKNDGSVEGKRYFECRPHFGLFAPITKVSKSPLKYKPGNCVIHSGAGLPPSGIKRAGSKESMTSMTSSLASATSGARRVRLGVNSLTPQKVTTKSPASSGYPTRTALQDVLREKQQHIEQLLKERDLERAEVTRAANQADDAEQKLTTLRSEYEHYRSECESKLQEYSVILSQLNIDRGSLLSQLDDEKRKNEDLQFRFEEAAITKGDIEQSIVNQNVTNESNIRRIKDLEEQLTQERQKVENLEADSGKLFEAEEALVKTREEVDLLKNDLQHAISKRSASEEQHADSITTLKKQLETTQQQLEQSRVDSTQTIEKLQADLSASTLNSQATRSTFDTELEEYRKRLQKKETDCSSQDEEIAALKAELAQTKALLAERTAALEKKISESNEIENNLKTELERSKRELSAKLVDLENNTDAIKSKEHEVKSLKTQLETTAIDLKSRVMDVERYQRSLQETEVNYKNEIEQLRKELKAKILEKEEQDKTSAIAISQRDTKLEDANKTISQHLSEIEKLKSDLSEAKETIERTSTEIHDRHARQIEVREAQLMAMAAELQQKNEEITKCSIVTSKLEDDICTKNGAIEKLRLELDSFKRRFESEQMSISRYNEQINTLQLTVGDLQRKLISADQRIIEVTEQKQRLEAEIQSLMSSTGDYSVKLQDLNSKLLEKERIIETVRAEFLEKLQISQRVEQQLKIQLQKFREDTDRSRINYEERLKTSIEAERLLRQRCEVANAETAKVRDELMLRVNELQRLVEEKDFALKKTLGESSENQQFLKDQLGRATAELHKTIESCQRRIDELTTENINSKNVIAQKSELIIETESKLKHFMAQTQQTEIEIRRTFEEQIKKIEFQLGEKNAQLQQYIAETELLKRDCMNQNVNIAEKDHKIAQLINQLQATQQLVAQLQSEKDRLQLMQIEAAKECAANNQQCNDLLNQVAILSNKAEMADKLAQELRMQKTVYTRLFEQLQITERQKQTLIARLEDAANKNGESDKCYYMLELAKNLQATNSDEQAKRIVELQQTIAVTQQQLADSENQLRTQKNEILRLQEALFKVQQECATQGPGPQNSSQINNNAVCTDHQQLLEEKQLAEGQVQFLNSIIVDMQRKNEEQRARIEILESGYSPAAADELKLYRLSDRSIPPRVYCDICEEFDKHETEDCPLQATDDDPNPCSHPRMKKDVSSDRPYCEICEVFGHCTEDCKDDQTF
ncbi:hypothetical protein ILUMI_01836 [Ignelater luminosus]|uniref:CAP-Gly domain-containing protein n=1 Tax=Ignelater luminosus TaxID=2038154 RepID=A0A8K0DHP4_IGNLU|nr:hypothetical protein ILUMI_01836 [Ignelater luminosus]